MNWLWVGVATLLLLATQEFLRRSKTHAGSFISQRLKTFSARLTVAFLASFAVFFLFTLNGISVSQRLVVVVLDVGLVIANFIHLEKKET